MRRVQDPEVAALLDELPDDELFEELLDEDDPLSPDAPDPEEPDPEDSLPEPLLDDSPFAAPAFDELEPLDDDPLDDFLELLSVR